jgi:S1-C subfamily serine protease
MRSIVSVILLAVALTPISGCVIAVGNDSGYERREWRDAGDHPRMGVTLGSVDEALASQLGIDEDDSTLILGVVEGMPADKAGVKVHDVVVQINGKEDASPEDLRRAIRRADAGVEVKLRVIRAGQPVDLAVVLGGSASSGPDR